MSARDELTDFITDLVYKAGVLDALMDHEQAAPIHRRIDSLMSGAEAEVRAEALREAAKHIEAEQKRSDDHEVSRFGKLDHESVLERDAVLAAVAELRLMAEAAVSGSTAGDEQAEPCRCGPQMRCPNGHCSRHYMCQDCGNCCSCQCAGGDR
jgi:hypothetical protein